MRTYYSSIAEVYDASRGYPPHVLSEVFELILDDRDLAAVRIVDIGAGTGLLAVPLAEQVACVVAVDPSEEMLGVLRRKADASGATNIETMRGVAEALPVPASSFDIAITSHVLHLTDRERADQEIDRVLNDEGAHVDCRCNWPKHRQDIEAMWLAAKAAHLSSSRGRRHVVQRSSERAPDYAVRWRLDETVADRLWAYRHRSHGSCWGMEQHTFDAVFHDFSEAVLKEFGASSTPLSSECIFEVFVRPKSALRAART
ncbi:MAG: class I SAM-dependent methyltransferase [Maricaulaceae bacterium]|jgi:ubiquinone/menaquinone biosynthesis C-methylase UbiE